LLTPAAQRACFERIYYRFPAINRMASNFICTNTLCDA